jgi:hypothetical protein
LSHEKEKKKPKKQKKKKTKKQNQNTTKCPKFRCNTVSVSSSACRCSLVVISSKEEKKKESGGRQVCERLSEAVVYLPAAVRQLLLQALLMSDLRSELNTHLAPQDLFT